MNRVKLKQALLAWAITSFATAAFGCECGWVAVVDGQRTMSSEPPTLSASEVKGYVAVFSGKVAGLNVQRVVDKRVGTSVPEGLVVTFHVLSSWKGVRGREYVVRTPSSTAACGYGFELGEEYLVYVKNGAPDFKYGVDLCSRTKRLALAANEIGFLDGLKPWRRRD